MTDARHDEGDDDALLHSREQGEARELRDDALPDATLAALRAAWSGLPAPAPTRELDEEDEATRRAVGWLVAAWRSPEVVAPHAATSQHAPLAFHAAQRALASRAMAANVAATDPAARRSDAGRSAPRRTGWRRQVAAAALLVALLGAAWLLRDAPGIGANRPSPGAPGPVAAGDPPAVPSPSTAPGPAPAQPRVVPMLPLLATASPPPIELRAGHTRVLLFTESTRRTQEIQP